MVLTVVCYLGFRILSFSRDTSCIVAVIFLVSAEFMIPILEIVEELRDLEETPNVD